MEQNARQLIKDGDHLFQKKQMLNSLMQEIADNFYPERADFTYSRALGNEFADHLMNSYPVMARRDLGNSFSSMLRRDNWFTIGVKREPDGEGKAWLEWATNVQRRAMYDRVAQFTRATKEGDQDFAAFGQCALTIELNRTRDALLYRCWHLRDLAWCEGEDGTIDSVHQKWKPTCKQLCDMFPKTVDRRVQDMLRKDPYREIDCRRIVLPSEDYDAYGVGGARRNLKFTSIYLDVDHETILEEKSLMLSPWVIPRWQTVSGSQYAFSPATIVALPDARLVQAMALVLLDAGEKAADPPLIAVQEAIRSDIDVRAGGITWVDEKYDERMGEVLRPMTIDSKGLPNGLNMAEGVRTMISEAFYLNKLTLPMQAGDMTATEVSQRVQEYIRQALPLFEPLEQEYNASICEATFQLLFANGGFGNQIPDSLKGQDVEFKFISPLKAALEREKGTRMSEALNLTAAGMQLDPTALANFDVNQALRDALEGIGVPARWIRDEEATRERADQIEAEQQAAKIAAFAEQAAKATPAGVGAGAQANAGTAGVGGPFGA